MWRINIGNESWFLSSETSDLGIFQEKCPEGNMSGEEWEWENAHFYFNINRFVHRECVPRGDNGSKEFCWNVARHRKEKIQEEFYDVWI